MDMMKSAGNRATSILLALAFFLLVLPAGLVMRLFMADPMRRDFDRLADSYRVPSKKAPAKALERTR
jgi:hypothetical protein